MASYNSYSVPKTTLIAENTEYEIENVYILKSPYIREIKAKHGENESMRIFLPKWVTKYSLEKVLFYLKYGQLPDFNDSFVAPAMQRLLWLSDFLRIDDFQHKFIKETVLPNLNYSNCLTFLNESFKKLKISEESSDSWYVLFNNSMNVMAKNLSWNYQNRRNEVLQTNEKILEEIVERSLKQETNVFNIDHKEAVEILVNLRKKNDAFELLESQRKIILEKKYTSSGNQPSITWKLSNISNIVEKETSSFQLGGFSWKLAARKQRDDLTGTDSLVFYLKFDNPIDAVNNSFLTNNSQNYSLLSQNKQNSFNTNSARNLALANAPTEGILTVYFSLKANGTFVYTDIQIRSLNFEKNPSIKLYTLEQYEIMQLADRENEFIVNLNVDYVYSAILVHICKNIEFLYSNSSISSLSKDDIWSILKYLPNTPSAQDNGLMLTSFWIQSHHDEKDVQEILKSLEWDSISIGILMKVSNSPAIKANIFANQFLDREVAMKMGDSTSYDRNNVMKSSYFSDVRPKRETNDFLGGSLKTTSSQAFLPRGRFFNQNQNGEAEHPRHSSLQREPLSRNASLNTSLKNSDLPSVPRLLQNRSTTSDASPSPSGTSNINARFFDSRPSPRRNIDEPPRRHPESGGRNFSQPHSMNPSLSNLNFFDQKTGAQPLYSPQANFGFQSTNSFNNVLSAEKNESSSPIPFNNNKGMLNEQSAASNNYTSPLTSPTYKPHISSLTTTNPGLFASANDAGVTSPTDAASVMKNLSLSSSFNTQRRSFEKRVMTESEDAIGSRQRDLSLNRLGRESYDPVDFRRLNPERFERKSIEEVRESYSTLEKSTQEKIAIIRRVLYQEKESLKNDIFSQLDVSNFVVNGRADLFY